MRTPCTSDEEVAYTAVNKRASCEEKSRVDPHFELAQDQSSRHYRGSENSREIRIVQQDNLPKFLPLDQYLEFFDEDEVNGF